MGLDEIRVTTSLQPSPAPKKTLETYHRWCRFRSRERDTRWARSKPSKSLISTRLEGISRHLQSLHPNSSACRADADPEWHVCLFIEWILPQMRLAGNIPKGVQGLEFWEIDQRSRTTIRHRQTGLDQANSAQKIFSGEVICRFTRRCKSTKGRSTVPSLLT